ncbi:MAG: glycosyltransferase [Desulfobacteraceae bacterium]|nr:glycosyltransferase [Desulfobacteraceae bacterium]
MLKQKIKLVHLLPSLAVGGAENGVVNLMNNINTDIFDPFIVTFSSDGPLTARVNRNRVKLIDVAKRKGNDPLLPFRLWRLFNKIRPAIVHTHFWGTLVEGVTSAKMAGVPVIIHGEHGTIEQRKRNILVQRLFWHFCDSVVSISNALKYRLSETIGFDSYRITPIINGVDTDKFYPVSDRNRCRKNFNIPSDAFVVGTVGRLLPVKDQQTIIKALSIIKKKTGNKVLGVIAGNGPLLENLSDLSRSLGIENEWIMLGEQDNIPAVMNTFDVFALPSLSEGISNTILEAIACGLPVIATEVGGTVEIVDSRYGILIPPGDAKAFSSAVSELMNNNELRKTYAENARAAAEEKFSLSSMIKTYEKLYLSLLKQKNRIF